MSSSAEDFKVCVCLCIFALQKMDVNKALRFISLSSDWAELRQRVMKVSFDFSLVQSSRLANFKQIPPPLWDER